MKETRHRENIRKIKHINYGRISIINPSEGPFLPPTPCNVNISNSKKLKNEKGNLENKHCAVHQ